MNESIFIAIIALILIAIMGVATIYSNNQARRMREACERQNEHDKNESEKRLAAQRAEMEQRLQQQQLEMEQRLQRQQSEMEQRLNRQSQQEADQTRLHFKNLATEVLRQQSEALKAQNKEEFAEALEPVRMKLAEFSKAVNDSYVKETADRKSLADQIERLMKLNHDISQEAKNLTTALKGDSKVQGDWGEMVLQTLLESAGMIEGENFYTQVTRNDSGQTLKDENGNLLRPDVVVNLPDNHKIVIDSKVSLKAYTEYMSASDEAERDSAARRHITSVTNHINELGDKKYQTVVKKSADHVMMFIPNEGAYYAAMQIKPDLWKYAYDRNVVMISPTHLFSVMQIVAQLWKQDSQNKYALEIAKAGGELYDRFVDFYNDMAKVEKSMQDVVKNFDRCRQDVENRVGIKAKARKLRELGANATKNLPE